MIFFTSTSLSTFVKKDIEILRSIDDVFYFNFEPSRKWVTPWVMLRQTVAIIWNIRRIQLIVCMFAAYHSVIPVWIGKWLGIPSIIFVGGVDAVSYPSFRFGYFQHWLIRPFVKWTFKGATVISAKDDSLWWFKDGYYGVDFPMQGIDYFMPAIKARKNVIYNGYEGGKWVYLGEKKSKHFVTVAHGWQYETTLMRKGVDLILKVAPFFPDCCFEIIGVDNSVVFKSLPENVMLTGFVENQHLAEHIGRSQFYLQLSITEGFPNALCEAMLCRCIPIVSDVAAMPKIVGECGFILKKRDEGMLVQLIAQALDLGEIEREELGQQARDRIIQNFPIKRRARELTELVREICPYYQNRPNKSNLWE